jgi:hypothetical protein
MCCPITRHGWGAVKGEQTKKPSGGLIVFAKGLDCLSVRYLFPESRVPLVHLILLLLSIEAVIEPLLLLVASYLLLGPLDALPLYLSNLISPDKPRCIFERRLCFPVYSLVCSQPRTI